MIGVPTVLIVDDDRLNRAALAELLRDCGRLLLARDGPSALDIVQREDVTLILLDVSMPEMDGYEVLRRLKSDPETANIGVIFITGMAEQDDEERGLLLGAADYVQKPIRPAIVRARVQVHLRLAAQRLELERLSLKDGLTGISNRRYFDEAFDRILRQSARRTTPLGLAIVDVDHFKQYNDLYGHGAGDDALRQVARVLDGFARRAGDVAARYGGEEFVLLMQEASDFAAILERLRLEILNCAIEHQRSPTAPFLTLSGGGVVAQGLDPAAGSLLLEHADRLLYEAKRAGRNRINIAMLPALHSA